MQIPSIAKVFRCKKIGRHDGGYFAKTWVKIGRDDFFELLPKRGLLVVKRKRKGSITPFSRHRYKKFPNLIKEFKPTKANQQ